jgi:hypothetical protein
MILTLAFLEQRDCRGGRGGRYLCPLPACSSHQDARKHRSLHVDDVVGAYQCHRCHAAGMLADRCPHNKVKASGECGRCGAAVDDTQGAPRRSSREIAREIGAKRLASVFGTAPKPERRIDVLSTVAEKAPQPGALDKVRAALRGVEPFAGSPAQDYLRRRGVTLNDARGIVGYARSWLGGGPAVVFVAQTTAGGVCALQGRFLAPSVGFPKAMSIGTVSAGVFVTRGALAAETIAIAEAPIDALSCGLPALALFGCALGPDRLKMLRRALAWKRVILATDSDKPGEAAAVALREALTIGTRCVRLTFPAGVKDCNEWLGRDPAGFRFAVDALGALEDPPGDRVEDLGAYARSMLW